MRNALWLAVAGLVFSMNSFSAPAPSDPCQVSAYQAATRTIPAGAKLTGVFSSSASSQMRVNPSVGTVVLIGDIEGHEFSIAVHVKYLGNPHVCQVLQIDNLDWGDHI